MPSNGLWESTGSWQTTMTESDCVHHWFIETDGQSKCLKCHEPGKVYRVWWSDESRAMTAGRHSALVKAAQKRKEKTDPTEYSE